MLKLKLNFKAVQKGILSYFIIRDKSDSHPAFYKLYSDLRAGDMTVCEIHTTL